MKVLVLQHLEKTNCFPRCALYLGDVISGQNNKRRKKERKKEGGDALHERERSRAGRENR